MTVGTASLSRSLQALIDARLDTIDRMLLGWTPRQERLSIVREVESQIFELLHERDPEELSREDVLAVLARIDPPEAYLPEDDEEPAAGRATTVRPPSDSRRLAASKRSPARVSGILGLAAVVGVLLLPLAFVVAEVSESEAVALLLLGGDVMITLIASLLAIVLGVIGRRCGAWAIVGMVAGGFSLLVSLLAAGYLLLLLAST